MSGPAGEFPLEFGGFTLDRRRRELRVDGRLVALGGRAFDTLLVLVDARGTVLSKDELLRRIRNADLVAAKAVSARLR
jgi:DNA-binding winged helix-turn-helix (wHTH) protein